MQKFFSILSKSCSTFLALLMLLQSVEVSAKHCVSATGKHLAPTSQIIRLLSDDDYTGPKINPNESLPNEVRFYIEEHFYEMSPQNIAENLRVSNELLGEILNVLYKEELEFRFSKDQKNQLSAAVAKQLRVEGP